MARNESRQIGQFTAEEDIAKGCKITVNVEEQHAMPIAAKGKPLMHFKAGDLDSAAMEKALAGKISAKRKFQTSQFRAAVSVGRIGAAKNHVAPYIDAAGNISAIRSGDDPDKHVMFKPYVPGDLHDANYLRLGRRYRFALLLQPQHFASWPQSKNQNGFVIALECWGPSYPRGSKWTNPPLFLRWFKDEWQVGLKAGNPKANVAERIFSAEFKDEMTLFEIEYEPHGSKGYFSAAVNGKELAKVEGKPTCVDYNKTVGPIPFFGSYSYFNRNPGVGFKFAEVLIEELS